MLLISLTWDYSKGFYNVFITFQTPFDLFIIPGIFFYWRYKEKWSKEDKNKIKQIPTYQVFEDNELRQSVIETLTNSTVSVDSNAAKFAQKRGDLLTRHRLYSADARGATETL